ncbi:hypothetical protein [Saccharothrix sp. ST-888]|uniref:hypothetical protein n=1 Tax=Saccharothrix sp. ST-888 TaxID=1427391 RepID=UPI0005EBFC21|nr:hypothetical protein [Saccharothrix sp. ST-888]KJK56119.1 hypothetical protein UK12_24580 [Saccharothrix sp. ST-888]
MDERVDLKIGQRFRHKLPHSEVCQHMKVAGHVMEVEVRERGAQLYKDGREFSFPIGWGEAGIYQDRANDNAPYVYNAEIVEV